MKSSLKMFTYKGTPVYINLWFFLLFLFIPFQLVIILFFTILLHEMGHIYMAIKLGYKVHKGFVSVFGGGALVDETYKKSNKDAIKIGFAGPLANILLLIGSLFLAIIFGPLWSNYEMVFKNIMLFALINGIVAIFNLLPIMPLDGGRILFHKLSMKYNNRKSSMITAYISLSVILVLLIFSIIMMDIILILFTLLFIFYNISILKNKIQI